MAEESRPSSREFQLETRHLAAVIVLIALLCVASFMAGRWVERQAARATASGVLGQGEGESLTVEDVNRELTYFRTLGEGESSPEVDAPPPEPEARPAAPAPGSRNAPALVEESTLGGGRDGFMIQVMATKDLSSAIAMRQRLTEHGYRVVISEGREAADAGLRKVRVGPYGTRAEAERVAKRLQAEEGVRTWIP